MNRNITINNVTLMTSIGNPKFIEAYDVSMQILVDGLGEVANSAKEDPSVEQLYEQVELLDTFFNEVFGGGTTTALWGEERDVIEMLNAISAIADNLKAQEADAATAMTNFMQKVTVQEAIDDEPINE